MLSYIKRIFQQLISSDLLRYGVFPTSADAVAAAAVVLTSGAAGWTWGAWGQIVAAAGVTVETQVYGFTLEDFVGAPSQGEVQIGIGGAGAEAAIITVPAVAAVYILPKAIRVPVSTRLSARYRTSSGAADTVSVKLMTTTGF